MNSLAICAVGLVAEAGLGYPDALFARIGHPVTWIGAALAALDARLNRADLPAPARRARGFAALAALLAVCLTLAAAAQAAAAALPHVPALVVVGLLASTCLAQRSLDSHVRAVAQALETEGLDAARTAVGRIVGRDTAVLDAGGIARAAIESLAENFADGIVAPAFWLAVGGLPGGFGYKAVNTADSMIGHLTPRHAAFGFAAAKLDDVVNWPAARLAALWLVAAAALLPGASAGDAWRIARRDARGHASPNAGWPEAAMAGALKLSLGGPRVYAGRLVEDATIGDGPREIGAEAIRQALTLYRVACALEIAVAIVGALIFAGL
ncbi:Cobalamin biosynthesis protein CobD [Beijerinckiaceae bacterium RH AL1]|nr:Cobalamin biosynthesis protein CobD [Beijerinckiaceae bacterium RH AL8]VVB42208.1 Cobalamin biosynthesis protein CobD [Beijerinckiaceae bacterium RH CH11]VVC53192.1 Cobalamin biosynthesis protein CobD [Beijerinckiaceae bacterium RH AL1]